MGVVVRLVAIVVLVGENETATSPLLLLSIGETAKLTAAAELAEVAEAVAATAAAPR